MIKGNYLFYILPFLIAIGAGIFLGRDLTGPSNQLDGAIVSGDVDSVVIDSVDSLVIGRDISIYTGQAAAIIIGQVQGLNGRTVTVIVDEVLKGDPGMATINIVKEGNSSEVTVEDEVFLQADENVLLFLGKNSEGSYVIFAGPYGKYLIDASSNVSSIGDFKMSLQELKAKIQDALTAS